MEVGQLRKVMVCAPGLIDDLLTIIDAAALLGFSEDQRRAELKFFRDGLLTL